MSSSLTETVDVTMPQMGVSVAEGTIAVWRKAVGDPIAADETICEITTDKIDTEVPAPVAGTVAELLAEVDETVDVGVVIARIATGEAAAALDPPSDSPVPAPEPTPEAAAEPAVAEAPARPRTNGRARRYSPVVMRIASEHGIDLETIEGTGRGGRVRKQDVLALVEGADGAAAADAPLHIESPYRPDPVATAPGGGGHAEPLSRMRRTIGEHMKRSLDTAATCTTWIEVDFSQIEAARAKRGLTALAYVARCVVTALREHPQLNATLEGETYTRYDGVHLGIAVSLDEEGLIVPVVRDAHELSEEGLGRAIRDLARRARGRQLDPDEVRGGTFTITNPGQYGSIMATPVISQPQVAILDLEAVVKRAVVVTDAAGNDAIAIRPVCILGLSWDHRALDGVLAARFLATVKRHAESVQA